MTIKFLATRTDFHKMIIEPFNGREDFRVAAQEILQSNLGGEDASIRGFFKDIAEKNDTNDRILLGFNLGPSSNKRNMKVENLVGLVHYTKKSRGNFLVSNLCVTEGGHRYGESLMWTTLQVIHNAVQHEGIKRVVTLESSIGTKYYGKFGFKSFSISRTEAQKSGRLHMMALEIYPDVPLKLPEILKLKKLPSP